MSQIRPISQIRLIRPMSPISQISPIRPMSPIRLIRPIGRMGFSLVEVLIAVTILSLFLVAAMTVATYFLQNNKSSQYKILASHLAEEGAEWAASEKDADWSSFVTRDVSGGSGTTYCLKNLNWVDAFVCPDFTLGTPAVFKREILITNSGSPPTQVNTFVTVSWLDTNGEKNVIIKNIYSISE